MKFILPLLFISVYFFAPANAQNAILSGKVIDEESGKPLKNVEVTLLLDITKIASTSDEGIFTFKLSEYKLNSNYFNTTFPLHIYKEGYDYIVRDFSYSNGRALNIKLKKGTKKGFFINAIDAQTGRQISGLSIFIPESNKSVKTNEFGNVFIELPKKTEEYKPIQINCKYPHRYEEEIVKTTLKDVRRYLTVKLYPIPKNYRRSYKEFTEKFNEYINFIDLNVKDAKGEKSFIDLYEYYKYLIEEKNLSGKEKGIRTDLLKIKYLMDEILGSYLNNSRIERLSNDHVDQLRKFYAQYTDFRINKNQSAKELPAKIDQLTDLGVELVKIKLKLYHDTGIQEVLDKSKKDINLLKELIKQERKWQTIVEQKMREQPKPFRGKYIDLIKRYKESIENNQFKIEEIFNSLNRYE